MKAGVGFLFCLKGGGITGKNPILLFTGQSE